MEGREVSDCEWCGQRRDLEQPHWYYIAVDSERLFFCSLECRARWCWKNEETMPRNV